MPCRSVTMWRFVPGLPRSVGFGPVVSPPFLLQWTRCPCRPGSSPVDPPDAGESVMPDEACPKLQQSPPACHSGATSHLARKHLPWNAGQENEQYPRQCRPVRKTGAPTFGAWRNDRKKRSNNRPEFIGDKRCGHIASSRIQAHSTKVLKGALNAGEMPSSKEDQAIGAQEP